MAFARFLSRKRHESSFRNGLHRFQLGELIGGEPLVLQDVGRAVLEIAEALGEVRH